MAEKKPQKPAAKVAKKSGKRIHELYVISAEKVKRKNKHCPKCGPGVFLAQHSDRQCCGFCHYVEYGKKG